jgi:hypothetical protein
MDVLNPALYQSLRSRFGEVKVANEGQIHHSHEVEDFFTHKKRLEVSDPGEYYRVCCPQCGDSRFRLYINYKWNTIGPHGEHYGKNLAHCFNEQCDQAGLEDELKIYVQYRAMLTQADQEAARPVSDMFKSTELPGKCVDLSKLPDHHPAIEYLRSRDFDPVALQRDWGVTYCESAEDDGTKDGYIPGTHIHSRLVRNRIIIPINWQYKLVGWQARAIGDHKIKYYTMPGLNKNYMLFNGDRAKLHRFGVVVEGVFDVFRVGTRAVGLLGKSMSLHQRRLASAYWHTGAIALMLDPDALEDMENIQKMLNPGAFRWGAFPVQLPDNNDPADMKHEAVWHEIQKCARSRGVQLSSIA